MDNMSSICSGDLYVSSRTCPTGQSTSGQPELISYFQSLIIITVNRVAINTVLGLSGIASNFINMCVFLKQGLHVSMNINFFVLATVDLLRTINYLWMTVCSNPEIETLERLDTPFIFQDIQYLTNGWISGSLERVTIFIIAFMTVQRCFSILKPLTIKRLITPVRSAVILFAIFLINGIVIIPGCISIYRFYPSKNLTFWGSDFFSSSSENEGIAFAMHVVLYVISLCVLIFLKILLVLQMEQQTKWRLNVLIKNQHPVISKRDKKISKLVSLLALVYIVFCTPSVVVSTASHFVPDFSVSGKQVNLFLAVWSFAHVFGEINANLKAFIYYNMSSKYRQNFKDLFSFAINRVDL